MRHCTVYLGRKSFRAKVCDTLLSQTRGLLFSKKKAALFLFNKLRRISVHMFFMSHALDVLWLDADMRVVEIKRNLQPWMLYRPKRKAQYMLEVPSGSAKNICIGDKISVSF